MRALAFVVLFTYSCAALAADDFKYYAPGKLQHPNSGTGDPGNRRIYADYIGLPMALTASQHMFANSQVYGHGGMYGGGGDQCDSVNYSMPWADNFCEKRTAHQPVPLCPKPNQTLHQGTDIRPPLCKRAAISAIAVTAGTIIGVNKYTSSVTLKSARDGTNFIYLHLEPSTIPFQGGETVAEGQELGKISNFEKGTHETTYHLHFEMMQNVDFPGVANPTHVPPYPSIVHAYRKRLGLPDLNNNGVLKQDPGREL